MYFIINEKQKSQHAVRFKKNIYNICLLKLNFRNSRSSVADYIILIIIQLDQ
jgi:hypothetical protein